MKRLCMLVAVCALLLSGCARPQAAPPETQAAPPETQAAPPETQAAPPETTAAPPETQAAPPETQAAPPLSEAGGAVIEIREKLFIAQTNDVYLNPEDYLGKTLKYEGLFKALAWEGADYYYVIRYGPGCCGYDGEAGFEVVWDGALPQEDDWCEAVGVLEAYEESGITYLRLVLSALTVLETRGAEFVYQ